MSQTDEGTNDGIKLAKRDDFQVNGPVVTQEELSELTVWATLCSSSGTFSSIPVKFNGKHCWQVGVHGNGAILLTESRTMFVGVPFTVFSEISH